MLHALLHGDIPGAFKENAFVVMSLPAIIFLAWVESKRKTHQELYRKVYSTTLIIIVGVLLLLWTLIRNIFSL